MSRQDYLLPGNLRLCLIDAPPALAAGLGREVGPFRAAPATVGVVEQVPDVTIRIVDRLPQAGLRRSLGRDFAEYDDAGFVLIDDSGHRTRLPLEQFGEPLEIMCELGTRHVPLFRDALALRLLATGRLLLHSSSFRLGASSVLAMGWQKGGKTELLLACMAAGASFVSDEWTVVDPVTRAVEGMGDRLFVWDWHLEQLPSLRARLSRRQRLRLLGLRVYRRAFRVLGTRGRGAGPLGAARRLASPGGIARLAQVQPRPGQLFGERRLSSTTVDLAALVAVGGSTTVARPVEPAEVARRMTASQAYERRGLLEAYAAFRSAFPERRNELLESAQARDLDLLTRALEDLPAIELLHPYPVPLADLHAALVAAVEDHSGGR